uniref:uncharacterized protein LOC101314997 n=1 Tax=Fragaria vesca subsp. vesca TaxID=101020 RepID=UPI0005C8674B|nr:PREDICTED: uncharacterized protein LOC101314997 [Fragaria vesca subsp. vesca]
MSDRLTGKVKWFNDQKGFDFITPENGGEDLSFHQSSIRTAGFRTLGYGESVEFQIRTDNHGRSKAVDVIGPEDGPVQGRGSGGGYGGGGGGGRYSGGGGGGGASGGCYQCGESGHFARECPKRVKSVSVGDAELVPVYECQNIGLFWVDIPLAIQTSQRVNLEPAPDQEVLLEAHLNMLGEPKLVKGRLDPVRQQLIRDMIIICYNHTKLSADPSSNTKKTGYFRVEDCKIVGSVTTIQIHAGHNDLWRSLEAVIREKVLENYKAVPGYEESAELEYFLDSIEYCETEDNFAELYFQPAVGSKADTAFLLLDLAIIAPLYGALETVLRKTYLDVERKFEKWEYYKDFKDHVTPGQFPDNYRGLLNCCKTVCHHFNEYVETVETAKSLEETLDEFLKLFPTLPVDYFQQLQSIGFKFKPHLLESGILLGDCDS